MASENYQKVGVVGAGQMGGGIAHVFALGGFDVCVFDADPEQTDAAIADRSPAIMDPVKGREGRDRRRRDDGGGCIRLGSRRRRR